MNSLIQDFCELQFYCRSYPNWTNQNELQDIQQICTSYVSRLFLRLKVRNFRIAFCLIPPQFSFKVFKTNFDSLRFIKLSRSLNFILCLLLFSVCFAFKSRLGQCLENPNWKKNVQHDKSKLFPAQILSYHSHFILRSRGVYLLYKNTKERYLPREIKHPLFTKALTQMVKICHNKQLSTFFFFIYLKCYRKLVLVSFTYL